MKLQQFSNSEQQEIFIDEGILDVPSDIPLEKQLDLISDRAIIAKRALGIANKFNSLNAKKKHRGHILGMLNQLRGLISRIIKQLEQQDQQSDTTIQQQAPAAPQQQQSTTPSSTGGNWPPSFQ